MEEYENYISVALLLLLAILQPHRWKYFTRKRSVMVNFFHVTNEFFILFSIQNPDFCAFFV